MPLRSALTESSGKFMEYNR